MIGALAKSILGGGSGLFLLALAALAAGASVYGKGRVDASALCQADALRQQLSQRDATVARLNAVIEANDQTLARARARAEDAAKQIEELENRADALILEFSAREAVCPIDGDDARRLRAIR